MKCPYCNREMKLGYVANCDMPVQWIPQESKIPFFRGQVAKGGRRVGKGGYWSGYRAEAYYCGVCRMIMIPDVR